MSTINDTIEDRVRNGCLVPLLIIVITVVIACACTKLKGSTFKDKPINPKTQVEYVVINLDGERIIIEVEY